MEAFGPLSLCQFSLSNPINLIHPVTHSFSHAHQFYSDSPVSLNMKDNLQSSINLAKNKNKREIDEAEKLSASNEAGYK